MICLLFFGIPEWMIYVGITILVLLSIMINKAADYEKYYSIISGFYL